MGTLFLVIGVTLVWLLLGLGCWLGFQLLRQSGRILLRLDDLEQRLAQPALPPALAPPAPSGLPIGSAAPDFELPDLKGERRALSQFRGRKVLLVFFNPSCGFCVLMAPDLAALPFDGGKEFPVPLVVSSGGDEAIRALVDEHGIRCPVLLQEGTAVSNLYQAHGTPVGYLIDEQGHIASGLAAGAQALLALAGAHNTAVPANANGHAALGGKRTLAESKIKRNGLPAGTPAPDFTLPRLDGGEVSLEEFRGRKVLLVFSDPNCGPCDALAPRLGEEHRASPHVQVLMVSRGDPVANQAKAEQHGLTFPVALQRQWEVSRQYAMFATPVGYLIDEDGVIAADVATGVEPVVALLSRNRVWSNGKVAEQRCRCGKLLSECGCGKPQTVPATGDGNGR